MHLSRNNFPANRCKTLQAEQIFWLPDRPTYRAFPSRWKSGIRGVRPRLQQRDCDGFTPSSLCLPGTNGIEAINGSEYTPTLRCVSMGRSGNSVLRNQSLAILGFIRRVFLVG